MSILVTTNVVASRPPERRPTGTPHARVNCAQENPPYNFVAITAIYLKAHQHI